MRLILDEGMPLRSAALLREAGVEATHVLELKLGGAADHVVLDRARRDGAVVATLDADFHQILATTGASHPSVIRVRLEGVQAKELAALLLRILNRSGDALYTGALVTVAANRVRLRRLPIQR